MTSKDFFKSVFDFEPKVKAFTLKKTDKLLINKGGQLIAIKDGKGGYFGIFNPLQVPLSIVTGRRPRTKAMWRFDNIFGGH